jgi:hypothetical protein
MIGNERQLSSFLESNNSSSPSNFHVNATLSRSSYGYQTAYKVSGGSEDPTFKESEAAKVLLQKLKIEMSMHSEWPYRLRRWISSELVEKCVQLSDELKNRQNMISRTAKQEYDLLEKRRKEQSLQSGNNNNSWGISAFSGGADSAWGGFSGTAQSEEQARLDALKKAEETIARKHDQLQKYLDVTQDRSCKDYVLDRLRQLAAGKTLSAYEWNGGGKWRGKNWSSDSLPTDAQIILHLFVTKLNFLISHKAHESGMRVGATPFRNRYLIITPQVPDPKNKDVLIWIQRRNPVHIKVVVGKEVWEVAPGSNNLFHALVLYIYAVAKEERGVIEMVSLHQTLPDLINVVSERK